MRLIWLKITLLALLVVCPLVGLAIALIAGRSRPRVWTARPVLTSFLLVVLATAAVTLLVHYLQWARHERFATQLVAAGTVAVQHQSPDGSTTYQLQNVNHGGAVIPSITVTRFPFRIPWATTIVTVGIYGTLAATAAWLTTNLLRRRQTSRRGFDVLVSSPPETR